MMHKTADDVYVPSLFSRLRPFCSSKKQIQPKFLEWNVGSCVTAQQTMFDRIGAACHSGGPIVVDEGLVLSDRCDADLIKGLTGESID